jgi:error-prone DNA polymerase
MTIEDETGIANVVVWPSLMERFRKEVMGSRLPFIEGRVQRSPEGIIHLVAERLVDRSSDLALLSQDALSMQGDMPIPLANADEVRRPAPEGRVSGGHTPRGHPRNVRVMPKSRDFH